MKEPWSWYSDLGHIPSELARAMAKSRSTMWITTSSPIKSQALPTQHTTTSEACREWVKSNNFLETFANSPSLLSSLSPLPRGRSVSSSFHRRSLMEGELGSFGAPCGVGLASRRFILAWYVHHHPNFTKLGEQHCSHDVLELQVQANIHLVCRQRWPAWLQLLAHSTVSFLANRWHRYGFELLLTYISQTGSASLPPTSTKSS